MTSSTKPYVWTRKKVEAASVAELRSMKNDLYDGMAAAARVNLPRESERLRRWLGVVQVRLLTVGGVA